MLEGYAKRRVIWIRPVAKMASVEAVFDVVGKVER